MDEFLKGKIGGNIPTGASNGNDGSDSEQGNPLVAVARLSKALAPWYRTILTLIGVIGSALGVHTKIMKSIENHDEQLINQCISIIDKKTTIPFHDLSKLEEKVDELSDKYERMSFYVNAPPYQAPRRKK